MNPQSTSLLLPLLVPFLYMAILLCAARITGWHSLSRRFPVPKSASPASGRLWRGSLRMGVFGHYNHCVIWSLHEEGLRIAPWLHLRIGHAPIFLPWNALRFAPRSRLWLLEGLDIQTRDGDRLWLPLVQARHLRQLSQGRFWPISPATKEDAPAPAPASEMQATPLRG